MQYGQFVVTSQRSDLLNGEPIRRSINKPAAGHHGRWLRQPCGIPERANFAPRLIARTGAAIESFIAWGVEKKSMLHAPTVLSRSLCPISVPRVRSRGAANCI